MKKNILVALASLVMVTSCSEDVMDKINKDNNNPSVDVVPAKFSITDAIMSSAFSTISGNYSWLASTFTEQEFGTGNNQLMKAELRNPSEVAASTTYNNEWNGTYGNIANLRNIIKKTSPGG
ncbi:MAG: SusD/RagB family nutrient-binding outer membrane lipoprotein, partial [Bacteroidales bacterium]